MGACQSKRQGLVPKVEVYDDLTLIDMKTCSFSVGVEEQQGYRKSMEDKSVSIVDFPLDVKERCSFFAVYDGHAGVTVSNYLAEHLHETVRDEINGALAEVPPSTLPRDDLIDAALQTAFARTDAELGVASLQYDRAICGSCAVVALIVGDTVFCANVGDSRAVLCRNGKALDLSVDQKATRKDEMERIQASGGFVARNRVVGQLAVSRAFGDFGLKDKAPLVIADPEVKVRVSKNKAACCGVHFD
jgi:serine/threonine protein phosphatase PrpC